MKRRIAALISVLLAAGVLIALGPASPAYAAPAICPRIDHPWSAWVDGASWGRFRWCTNYDYFESRHYYRVEVDDTASDGYQVHMEMYRPPGALGAGYHDIPQSEPCFTWETLSSTGPIEISCWGGSYTIYDEGDHFNYGPAGLRIVKGAGAVPGPHQFVASNFAWLN